MKNCPKCQYFVQEDMTECPSCRSSIPAAGSAFRFREGDVLRLPQGKNIQRLLITKVWPSGSANFQPVGRDWTPLRSRWGTYLGWSGSMDGKQYDCATLEGNIAQKQN